MQGIEIHRLQFDVDIWCDCGTKFNMKGETTHSSDDFGDVACPNCGALYGMLPARIDGE